MLDSDTFSMMYMPRCGMPDMDSETDMLRKKRYALGSRWRMTDLTWRIDGWTPDLPVADVDRIMDEALTVRVANLKLRNNMTLQTFINGIADYTE